MIHSIKTPVAPALLACALAVAAGGCRAPSTHRQNADRAAYTEIAEAQHKAVGHAYPLLVERPGDTLRRRLLLDRDLPHADPASLGSADVERIPQWPDPDYGRHTAATQALQTLTSTNGVLGITLLDALQIAARESRDYQDQKEQVFAAALRLDLERDAFRNTWSGILESLYRTGDGGADGRISGIENQAGLGLTRKLMTGGSLALNLGLDLVKLLTQDASSALGVLADATLSVPLLRGAGRFVVTEPLTQAERDTVYAIYAFERFRRTFAVRVASDYLGVLQQLDQLQNAGASYERLVVSTRRARRLADAGRLPEIQVDQARQDELRARNRWVLAKLDYDRRLDAFKTLIGLPPDIALELDRAELDRQIARAATMLDRMRETAAAPAAAGDSVAADAPVELRAPSPAGGGPQELDPTTAVRLALRERLDLRTRIGRVFDAQRAAAVAADQLRADLLLLGRGAAGEARNLGSAGAGDASLDLSGGQYSASLALDPALERTAERNRYRLSLIAFEKSVRDVQEIEDQIKLDIRDDLRSLQENRETVVIQAAAVEVARRRRDSTSMFLEAGRAQIRDLLEAEESLVSTQNALSAALVSYRVGELRLQRDMDVLEVDETGLWKEYVPVGEP